MKRKILASREMEEMVKLSSNGKVSIYSFFPCDRAVCPCQKIILGFKKKLPTLTQKERRSLIEDTRFIQCPRDKTGMKRYKVSCKSCGETQGYCWATNNTLQDFFDFHYVQWTDGERWYGCLAPHISPITEELCIECVCGQDTRDFRANMTLPFKVADRFEKSNMVGRKFGRGDSKFKTRVVGRNVLPFKVELWPK